MTSQPEPAQPEGANSLPPRHRPNLNQLDKTTTESELWSLEEDFNAEGSASDQPKRVQGTMIPELRQRKPTVKPLETSGQGGEVIPAQREFVRMDVGKMPAASADEKKSPAFSSAFGDFEDLEAWDDVSEASGMDDTPQPAAAVPQSVAPLPPEPQSESQSEPQSEPEKPASTVEPEFISAGVPQPAGVFSVAALRPRLGLSGFERIGMIALGVLLLVGAIYFYAFSVKRLPSQALRAETTDFPMLGERFSVEAADTGWRIPITDGPDADTVRRGTQLIPEIRMQVKGRGALRVFFRDDERLFVGDAVTREVGGEQTLRIAATAGFDDVGMHAAYRTGGTKPWTASVYEGESVNSPGSGFKLLFEMNISTDIR